MDTEPRSGGEGTRSPAWRLAHKINLSMRHDSVLAIVEQGLNGLTNVALIALFARIASASDTGKFALVLLVMQVAMLLSRGAASTVIMTLPVTPTATSGGSALSLLIGLLSFIPALIVVQVQAFEGVNLALLFIACGFMPFQDFLRHLCFRKTRYGAPFLAAILWIIVMSMTYFLLGRIGATPFQQTFGAWACGGAVSTAILMFEQRVIPNVAQLSEFCRQHRRAQLTMSYEQLAGSGMTLITLAIISWIGSVAHVGIIRVAQAAASPVGVVIQGLYSFAIPRLASSRDNSTFSKARFRSLDRSLLLMVLGVGGAYAVLFYGVERSFGQTLFGVIWDDAAVLSYWFLFATIIIGLATSSISLLRGLDTGQFLVRIRTITTVIVVCVQLLGYQLGGITGLGWAAVLSSVVAAALWRMAMLRKLAILTTENKP